MVASWPSAAVAGPAPGGLASPVPLAEVAAPATAAKGMTPARTPPDSLALHRAARDAQARFERLRLRHLPRSGGTSGGGCDERVGRFCTRYDEGDWAPTPESSRVAALRAELLATLDSVGLRLPGDDWVVGQRVWYRAEARRWEEAVGVARRCAATAWWCSALQGLALHGAGRFLEAEEAFGAALASMDEAEARDWRHPTRAVEGDAREFLEAVDRAWRRRDAAEARDWSEVALARFWLLADPLWLVPGNDRKTAHFARWTASRIRVGARNPYGTSWGRDLEELTVRHGWELGWERGWPRTGAETDVVGHKHPEGRDFFPPGAAVADPAAAGAASLQADLTRPRSLYAPVYAPLLLPMEGQLAVFPRGREVAVVATHFLPEDTTRHRGHDHPRPWLEPGEQAGLPDRAGLFLAPVGPALVVEDDTLRPRRSEEETDQGPVPGPGPIVRVVARDLGAHGGLLVQAPAGRYVVSVERWSPEARRAGRWRQGLVAPSHPPDLATLSDLLLVDGDAVEPGALEVAAAAALPRARVAPGEDFGVVWEVTGFGWRPEALHYTLTLRRDGGNLFRRAGRWLGVLGEDEPLRLTWTEAGPERPGAVLRHLALDPGTLEPGRYRLTLAVAAQGRGSLESELELEVVTPDP